MSAVQPAKSSNLVPPPTRRSSTPPPKGDKTAANTAPKKADEPDAVDLLVDDHLAVDACFKKYDKLIDDGTADQRKALAMEICKMLTVHTHVEEEIFYPAAREAGIDTSMLDEAQVEHDAAKQLIAELEAGSPADELYDAKVKVLGEYITHHVQEEHLEMFPKCRRIKALDLAQLRSDMEARKAALMASH